MENSLTADSEGIVVNFQLTLTEYQAIARKCYAHYHIQRRYLTLLLVVHLLEIGIFWAAGFFAGDGWWWLAVIAASFSGLYIFIRLWLNRQIRRTFQRESIWQHPVWLKVSEESISTRTVASTSTHNWSFYNEGLETDLAFVLLRPSRQVSILLKRGMTDLSQEQALRQLIARHLPLKGQLALL